MNESVSKLVNEAVSELVTSNTYILAISAAASTRVASEVGLGAEFASVEGDNVGCDRKKRLDAPAYSSTATTTSPSIGKCNHMYETKQL